MSSQTEMKVVTMSLEEDVVASSANDFKNQLKEVVQAEGAHIELNVDLANVGMIDSVGLGVFIAAQNTLHKGGGRLKVFNASQDIYKLFKVMRLDQHFEIIAI